MPSFDIVVETDLQEVDNAINQAKSEIANRYDFKGSKSKIDWDKKSLITLVGDDDYKLKAVQDILKSKLIKRNVSIKNMDFAKPQEATEGLLRQTVTLAEGIPKEKAKTLVKAIKESKLKVQSQIQEEQVRVSGKKRDDLQEVMNLVRSTDLGLDLQFVNMRD